ncbi:MAG: putative amidohydrolase [Lentimonas sp.]|jgi:predicted amidohydrolase
MKIALAQFKVVRGDPSANLAKIREFAAESKAKGACTLFLPEMCTTGFDWQRNASLLKQADGHRDAVAELAKSLDIAICGSFLEATPSGRPANTLYYFERSGEIAVRYRKVHLFTLFGEEKHMEAGDAIVTGNTELGPIGCSICYDLRFPELFRQCALEGAVIQVLPSAFPHPRLAHWRTLIQARAIENQVYFIATNQCGIENYGKGTGEIDYFGHSMVVDPWGEILLEANESEGVYFADIDIGKVTQIRSHLTVFKDRRPELY